MLSLIRAMVVCWRGQCIEARVTVRHKKGRRLVGDGTAKAILESIKITESKFANDAAL